MTVCGVTGRPHTTAGASEKHTLEWATRVVVWEFKETKQINTNPLLQQVSTLQRLHGGQRVVSVSQHRLLPEGVS